MTKKEFFDGMNLLFPNKYSTETILKYYNNYFNKGKASSSTDKITFPQFTFVFYDKISPSDETVVNTNLNKLSKITTSRSQSMSRTCQSWLPKHPFITDRHYQLVTPFDSDPMEKLKRIIISSNKDYVSYIKQKIEESGSGIINLHEFRHILQYFNIGLTSIEIEDILKRAGMTRDGKINLRDLLYFVTADDKNLVKASTNVKITLGEIKQLLYKYYSNPKLAFEFSDSRKVNKMDFDKFRTIVCEMYVRDGKKTPNFALLKTTFDFIDLRKDGIIDMNEWANCFGKTMGKLDLFKRSVQVDALRKWETSESIIEIYKAIARSRKFLWEKAKMFTLGRGQGNMINANNLIKILQEHFSGFRLTNTQWNMIVDIAKNDTSGFIDFDLFISIVEHCANKQKSQPRFK